MRTVELRHFDSDSYSIMRENLKDLKESLESQSEKQAIEKIISMLPPIDAKEKKFISIQMQVTIRDFISKNVSSIKSIEG